MTTKAADRASRFIYIMTNGARNYLVTNDFTVMLQVMSSMEIGEWIEENHTAGYYQNVPGSGVPV